jgi:hypothetical protein
MQGLFRRLGQAGNMERRSLLTGIFSLIAALPFMKIAPAVADEYEFVRQLGDGYVLKRRLLPKETWLYPSVPNYAFRVEKDGKIFRG